MMALDPVTAVFNFLCTEAGQKVVLKAEDGIDALANAIHGLIQQVHDQNARK